jgi:hypothetical protein
MFIQSATDFENPLDEPFDIKKITWFTVKANLSVTKKEHDEHIAAKQEQMAKGILQPNGLPAGITPEMLGIKPQPNPMMRPQQRILQNRLAQSNSNMGYLNRKPSPQEQFYSKFGIRK